LDKDISTRIRQEIESFLSVESADWYRKKGIPYRRGYLLHGPPGTGKTSFTEAIAGECKLNLCYLNLSAGTVNDDGLNRLLGETPSRSIILLEDIDAVFVGRE
jgi:chaperone BCS1